MNRHQRRQERPQKEEPATRSRKPRERNMPMPLIAALAGIVGLISLIVYLVFQTGTSTEGISASERAETDNSAELPGTFVPSQGGRHLSYSFTRSHTPVPYCDGVTWSGAPAASSTAPPSATATAVPTEAPHGDGDVHDEPAQRDDCYASNPPSSGAMLGGGKRVEVIPGALMDFPPAPNVYPRDIDLPREAVAHSLEHGGVFIGYNCGVDDEACWKVVDQLEDVANNRIDNHNDRVSMAYFSDLPIGEVGLSAWTRYERFPYAEFDKRRVERFVGTHSCRYDEEGFC